LLAETVERMYEREYNVSTMSDVCLHLAFICTETNHYTYTLIYIVVTFLGNAMQYENNKLDDDHHLHYLKIKSQSVNLEKELKCIVIVISLHYSITIYYSIVSHQKRF
jgi:hypothetical protein